MITLRARYCYVQSLTSLVSPEITRHDHSIIACSRHIYQWCCSSRTSRSWWITHSTQHHRRGCDAILSIFVSFQQFAAVVADDKPYVFSIAPQSDISVASGNTVSMPCHGSGSYNMITWYQGPFHDSHFDLDHDHPEVIAKEIFQGI